MPELPDLLALSPKLAQRAWMKYRGQETKFSLVAKLSSSDQDRRPSGLYVRASLSLPIHLEDYPRP